MSLTFVNRSFELKALKDRYAEDRFHFVAIYGKRRVGKTELIKQFIKDKPHVYFLADASKPELQMRRLARQVAASIGEPTPEVAEWDDVFSYCVAKLTPKTVIAIDEFPYMISADKSIPSVFQRFVDEYLARTNHFLILCGSSITMMETHVLGYRSPLYGRRTGQLKIEPLAFAHARKMLPGYDIKSAVEAYAILGGTPLYLKQFHSDKSVLENVERQILEKSSILYEEVDFILKNELREPATYMAVLEAMASGKTTLSEISDTSRVPPHNLPKYLNMLGRLQLTQRTQPVTEEKPKAKKTSYRLADQYFRFWFRYVRPRQSDVESGNVRHVIARIEKNFAAYVGKEFERVCKQILDSLNGNEELPFHYTDIGTWWGHHREEGIRKDLEIDIVAINRNTNELLACECKWVENVDGEKLLADLQKKTNHIQWRKHERKTYYAIFAKSFSKRPAKETSLAYDLQDIDGICRKA